MDVSVEELRHDLAEYVRRAVAGEDVVVIDGEGPVARLVAYTRSTLDPGTVEGWIDPPRRTGLQPGPRFPSKVSVLDSLEDR